MASYCVLKTSKFIELQDKYNLSDLELKAACKLWCDQNDRNWEAKDDAAVEKFVREYFNVEGYDLSEIEHLSEIQQLYKDLNQAAFDSANLIDISEKDLKKLFGDGAKFVVQKNGSVRIALPYNMVVENEIADILHNAPRNENGELLAPNGKVSHLAPRQYAQVRTKAFKKWFGDWENDAEHSSKVVDENGEPLVVYHAGKNANTLRAGKNGIWFTKDKYVADEYDKDITRAFFLNIRNPKQVDFNGQSWNAATGTTEQMVQSIESEQDGVVIKNVKDAPFVSEESDFGLTDDYVALDGKQAKSATDNFGFFDSESIEVYKNASDNFASRYSNIDAIKSYIRHQINNETLFSGGDAKRNAQMRKAKWDLFADRLNANGIKVSGVKFNNIGQIYINNISVDTTGVTDARQRMLNNAERINRLRQHYTKLHSKQAKDDSTDELSHDGKSRNTDANKIFAEIFGFNPSVYLANENELVEYLQSLSDEDVVRSIMERLNAMPNVWYTEKFIRTELRNLEKGYTTYDNYPKEFASVLKSLPKFVEAKEIPANSKAKSLAEYNSHKRIEFNKQLDAAIKQVVLSRYAIDSTRYHLEAIMLYMSSENDAINDMKLKVLDEYLYRNGIQHKAENKPMQHIYDELERAAQQVDEYERKKASKEIDDIEANVKTVEDAIEILGKRDEYKDVIKLLPKNQLRNIAIHVTESLVDKGLTENALGVNKIGINPGTMEFTDTIQIDGNSFSYRTLMHEVIHAYTSMALMVTDKSGSNKFVNYINDIIDHCSKYYEHTQNASGVEIIDHLNYGFSSPQEFIAEFFSNPMFQELLKNTPAMSKNEIGGRNLFEQIIDKIVEWFTGGKTDLYSQIKPLMESVIDYQASLLEDGVIKYVNQYDFTKRDGTKLDATFYQIAAKDTLASGINTINQMVDWCNEHTVRHPDFKNNHTYGQLISHEEYLKLKADERFKIGEKYYKAINASVTQSKNQLKPEGFVEQGSFDPNSPWSLVSSEIGTSVDTMLRGYWMEQMGEMHGKPELVERGKQLRADIKHISQAQYDAFRRQMDAMRDYIANSKFGEGGFYVCTDEFPISAQIKGGNTIAGTLDMLVCNGKGDYYIMDFKTYRSSIDDVKAQGYTTQLLAYKAMLEANFPQLKGKIKGVYVVPVKVNYGAAFEEEYSRYHYVPEITLDANGNMVMPDGSKVQYTPSFASASNENGTYTEYLRWMDVRKQLGAEFETLSPEDLIELGIDKAEAEKVVAEQPKTNTNESAASYTTAETWSQKEGWSVGHFEREVLPRINEAYQMEFELVDDKTPANGTGAMSYEYGNNKRKGVKAKSTFDAIRSGERTATTRYASDGNIKYWQQFKEGDVIEFHNGKRGTARKTVKVRITKPLSKLVIDNSQQQLQQLASQMSVKPDFKMNEVSGENISDPIQRQLYNLRHSNMTWNELNFLAKQYSIMVSSTIDYLFMDAKNGASETIDGVLEYVDEKRRKKLEEFNWKGATRDAIIQQVGLKAIMDYAKEQLFFTGNTKKQMNIDYIKDNWDGFLNCCYPHMLSMEDMVIRENTVDSEKDGEIGSLLDMEAHEEGQVEHWQINMRQIASIKALSKELKIMFGKIVINDENGEPVYDEYGYEFEQTVDSTMMIAQVFEWCNRCMNITEMINMLKSKAQESGNEWVSVVVEALENDSTLRSKFYTNFRKDGLRYGISYQTVNGKKTVQRITIVNDANISKQAINDVASAILSNALPWVNNETHQADPEKTIAKLIERHAVIAERIRKPAKDGGGFTNNMDDIRELIMDVFGINVDNKTLQKIQKPRHENFFRSADKSEFKSLWNNIEYFLKKASEVDNPMDLVEMNPDAPMATEADVKAVQNKSAKRNIKAAFNIIQKYMPITMESSTYQGDKMYYSYQPPSYLHKSVVKLTGGVYGDSMQRKANIQQYCADEFGYDKFFFCEATGRYRNGWLQMLANDDDPAMRESFDHKVQLTYNDEQYAKLSPIAYFKSIASEFFGQEDFERNERRRGEFNKLTAWYRVPILSDKPSSEFIRAKRFVAPNTDQLRQMIATQLFDVFQQEMIRIRSVLDRVACDGQSIKNFDVDWSNPECIEFANKYRSGEITITDLRNILKLKGGAHFFFLDKFNNIIEKDDRIAQFVADNLNYNNEDAENHFSTQEFRNTIIESIGDMLESIAAEDIAAYEQIGLFDTYTVNNQTRYKHLDVLGELGGDQTMRQSAEAKLKELIWNDFYAQTQMIQIFAGDLAFYKDTKDFQKRVAQIHAPASRLDKEAVWETAEGQVDYTMGNGRITDGYVRSIFLSDHVIKSELLPIINQIFDRAIADAATPKERDYLRKTKEFCNSDKAFGKVNVTDAQSYTTPTGYRKKTVCQGKWTNEMEDAYQQIMAGNFNIYNLNLLLQPLKPFAFSQLRKSAHNNYRTDMRVPNQQKNSEYMLFLADAIIRGNDAKTGKRSTLTALFDFMEDSAFDGRERDENGKIIKVGKYNGRGIDSIQFESAVKVGLMGKQDISGKSYADVIETLKKAAYLPDGGYDDQFVHTMDMDDYGIQQPVPEHFIDHEQQMGSQLRILSIGGLLSTSTFDLSNTSIASNVLGLGINGKFIKDGKLTSEGIRTIYETFVAQNIEDSQLLLEDELKLNDKDPKVRNLALSKLLQKEILKDSKYGIDMFIACSLNEDGEFNIPLQDPLQASRVEQLLNSIIKSRVCKQKMAGGPVVQSTNFGYNDNLKVEFYTDENGKVGVKNFECLITCPSEELEKALTKYDKDGNASLMSFEEAVEKGVLRQQDVDNLCKMIAYRIPTEGKYSMMPIKVVGFSPRMAGETIVLPQEITTLTGSDFDVDKMYVERYDGVIERNEDGSYFFSVYGETEEDFSDASMTDSNQMVRMAARNNALLDMQYAILTHPDYAQEIFNPGNFEELKDDAKYINDLKNDSDVNRNICQLSTQIYFHKQNMAAAQLIGVFANANTSHTFLGMRNTVYNGNSFTFCGHTIEQDQPFDTRLSFDGKPIAKNIASLLAASVDAVKDPVLNYLGINMTTVNIATFLTRCGYNARQMALLLNQPVVLKTVEMVESSKEGKHKKNLTSAIKAMYNELRSDGMPKKFDEYVESNDGLLQLNNFTEEFLKYNIEHPTSSNEVQIQTLVMLSFFNKCAKELDDVTFCTKLNSMSNAVGPGIADNIIKNNRAIETHAKMKSGDSVVRIIGEDGSNVSILEVDPMLNAFYEAMYGINGLSHKIFDEHFSHSKDTFNIPMMAAIPIKNPQVEDITEFVNDWALYNMSIRNKFIVENPQEYFDGTFFREFAEWRKNNPDSEIAKRLQLVVSRVGDKLVQTIDLTTDANTNMESDDKFRQEWADMTNRSDADKRMAMKLFEYSLIRGGMGFLPRNYGSLTPIDVKQKHPSYLGIIKNLPQMLTLNTVAEGLTGNALAAAQNRIAETLTFIKMYIENHTYDDRIVTIKSRKWFNEHRHNPPKYAPRVCVNGVFYQIEYNADGNARYVEFTPRGSKFKYKDYFTDICMEAVNNIYEIEDGEDIEDVDEAEPHFADMEQSKTEQAAIFNIATPEDVEDPACVK